MTNDLLEKHVGKFVNIFNEKMSLFGMLRKTSGEGRYRVDLLRDDGYYIFTSDDVMSVVIQNSTLIALK
jgi:hypothetical protein